jgi:hypothetical protein
MIHTRTLEEQDRLGDIGRRADRVGKGHRVHHDVNSQAFGALVIM